VKRALSLPKTREAMAKLDAAEAAFESTPDAELGAAIDGIRALELEAWLAFLNDTNDRNDENDPLLLRHPSLADLQFLRARCAEVSP
jgi:hypothetical protein